MADAGVPEGLLETGQVAISLLGRAEIGLADDLNERRAATVEVHIATIGGAAGEAVDGLAGVLLEMDTGEAHRAHGPILHGKGEAAALADGLIVLGNLVALGQVGIEIVLAGETRQWPDAAAHRQPHADGKLHGLVV